MKLTHKQKYVLLYGGIALATALGGAVHYSPQTIFMAIAASGLAIKAYLSNPNPPV